jgi:hypothetical protein
VPQLVKKFRPCYEIGKFITVCRTVRPIYTIAVLLHDCFSFNQVMFHPRAGRQVIQIRLEAKDNSCRNPRRIKEIPPVQTRPC